MADDIKYKPPELDDVYKAALHGTFVGKCKICGNLIKGSLLELREHKCDGQKEHNMDTNNKLGTTEQLHAHVARNNK